MKTGYVYIVALNGRFGRVLRLGTSLRDPADRLKRLARVKGRRRAPKLIGYEFVEDMIAARGQVRRALRGKPKTRTFFYRPARARAALKAAARRQATIRKARFDPESGLLADPDIELAGPVARFSASLSGALAAEAQGDLGKLSVFLHPYMVGTIATLFREAQGRTKIPDEYLTEILRDIAWRIFKCRLKPLVFIRMARRTRREQRFLDLARLTFERQKRGGARRRRPGLLSDAQLTGFMRAPKAHLGEVMRSYAETLSRAPAVRLRTLAFRALQLLFAVTAIFAVDAVMSGSEPGRWTSALLLVFFAGAAVLTFNLYEKPDLTRGIGILTRKEIEVELKALEGAGPL
jgi:hypothetical protein